MRDEERKYFKRKTKKKNHNHHIKSYGRTHASNMAIQYIEMWIQYGWVERQPYHVQLLLFVYIMISGPSIFLIIHILLCIFEHLKVFQSWISCRNGCESANLCKWLPIQFSCAADEIVMCGPFCSNNSQWNDLTTPLPTLVRLLLWRLYPLEKVKCWNVCIFDYFVKLSIYPFASPVTAHTHRHTHTATFEIDFSVACCIALLT